MGVHWKIQFLEGVHKKPIYWGGNCLIRGGGAGGGGAWTVCRFKGGLAKKEGGGVFEGGLIPPMYTMKIFIEAFVRRCSSK